MLHATLIIKISEGHKEFLPPWSSCSSDGISTVRWIGEGQRRKVVEPVERADTRALGGVVTACRTALNVRGPRADSRVQLCYLPLPRPGGRFYRRRPGPADAVPYTSGPQTGEGTPLLPLLMLFLPLERGAGDAATDDPLHQGTAQVVSFLQRQLYT